MKNNARATFAFATVGSCSTFSISLALVAILPFCRVCAQFFPFSFWLLFRLVHFGQVILFVQPKQSISHGMRITSFDYDSCSFGKVRTFHPLLSTAFNLFNSSLRTNVHRYSFLYFCSLCLRVDHRLVIHKYGKLFLFLYTAHSLPLI